MKDKMKKPIKIKLISGRGALRSDYLIAELTNTTIVFAGEKEYRVGSWIDPKLAQLLCDEPEYEVKIVERGRRIR